MSGCDICVSYMPMLSNNAQNVGMTDRLTTSLKYFCLDVCETGPWQSFVRSDDD